METVAAAVLTTSVGIWVGAIVFQSAVVAPAVFVDLEETAARSLLRTLFPRFFRLGLICGALMLGSLLWFAAVAGWTTLLIALLVVTGVMIVLEAISLAMVPRINAARDAGYAAQATFSRLHHISVLLTIAVLLLGISILVVVGARAAAGI
ncbi:MAG: DUF4149 domain-containing protein [Pseudomonadota bacterium]